MALNGQPPLPYNHARYDANGNMTGDGVNTLTYDAENRLLTSSGSTGSGTYTYDGNNLRVQKVSSSTTTVYIFSGAKVIAEYVNGAAPSAPAKEYIYSGTRLLATIAGSNTTYHHADHLSARVTTDSTGALAGQQGHFPFGESWYSANTTTKFQFTSYERDAESGNDNATLRYYLCRLGRFGSTDPLGGSIKNPQSLNRYAYVLNDPLNLVDPTGAMCFLANVDVISFYTFYPDNEGGGHWVFKGDLIIREYSCGDSGGGRGGQGGGGGGTDFANLKQQAIKALEKPACAALFGGLANALKALLGSSYNTYTAGQANPYPNSIPSATWGTVVSDMSDPNHYGRTVWTPSRPGGFLFFGNDFGSFSPGFSFTSPNSPGQMTGFMHEFEHAANHSPSLDSSIDANYPADYQKINGHCAPQPIETQDIPITGQLSPP